MAVMNTTASGLRHSHGSAPYGARCSSGGGTQLPLPISQGGAEALGIALPNYRPTDR